MKLIDILNMISKGELKEGTKLNLIADDYITHLYFDGEVIRFIKTDDIYAFTCKDINDEDEYELIEPECKHIWHEWSVGNRLKVTNYRRCKKCGVLEETVYNHFTDNGKMAEKIKELDIRMEIENFHDVEFIFTDIACKLNEVIRRINNVR